MIGLTRQSTTFSSNEKKMNNNSKQSASYNDRPDHIYLSTMNKKCCKL